MTDVDRELKQLRKELKQISRRFEHANKKLEAAKKTEEECRQQINDCAYKMFHLQTEIGKYDPEVVMKKLTEEEKWIPKTS